MRIAFDIIGSREKSVAVITDINISLKQAKKFAQEILSRYNHIKSVIWKTGKKHAKYRMFPYKHLIGLKNYLVIHKEYGYKIKINPTKVFFSPREGEERQRVAKQVKDCEKILLLFAGAGPFAVAIAKNKKVDIICVEWNPVAVKYAKDNIKMNKLKNVKILKMDARRCASLGKFDRILMPLGTAGIDYLGDAVKCAKLGTIIHLYGKSGNKGKDIKMKIKKIMKIKYKIQKIQKISNFSPGVEKIRVDIQI